MPATREPKLEPTLDEYAAFHGMFCFPTTASRCISSFSSPPLFMPSFAARSSTTFLNYKANYLNLATYYLLVILSLTGLSSLLNLTTTIAAVEHNPSKVGTEALELDSKPLHPAIVAHLDSIGDGPVSLKRRFEYHFPLALSLRVVMLHFSATDKASGEERLHLVEVYETFRRLKSD